MHKHLFLRIAWFFSVIVPAAAQTRIEVPFVPTPPVVVDEMLRLGGVGPGDFVMDLGSGDGRVLIAAAKRFGARGIGVDLDGELVAESIESAAEAGVADRVIFLQQDLFRTDLGQATVITMYLLPGVMAQLQPRLLALKPGTRLVSHDFLLGDWRPDLTTQIRKNTFLWIVPAKAAGLWQSKIVMPGDEVALQLELRQRFQEVDGSARFAGRHAQLWEARLSGDRLSFVIVDDRDRDNETTLYFEGRISGDMIEGRFRRGAGSMQTVHDWRALRASAQ